MKRTERMDKKPDQISVSLNRNPSLIPINSRPTPAVSHLPPLPQFTYFSCAKHASGRQSTVQNYAPPPSPHSFAPQRSTSSSSSIHHPPQRSLKNSPFPNQTSVLSHLSYIPEFSCRRSPCSSIPAICVSHIDGQFLLLAFFSRD